MTAKILQLVNSSFFGLYKKVETPSRAVKLLGIDMIKVLVIGLQIFDEIKVDLESFSPEKLWSHSLAVANCAQLMAREESDDSSFASSCFIGGLLHDIGKLVLATKLTEKYSQAMELARDSKLSLPAAEEKIIGTSQSTIGAYLVGLWGFGSEILEAIAFQGRFEQYQSATISAALLVHVANVAYYTAHPGEVLGPPLQYNHEYINKAGYQDRLPVWTEICAKYLKENYS